MGSLVVSAAVVILLLPVLWRGTRTATWLLSFAAAEVLLLLLIPYAVSERWLAACAFSVTFVGSSALFSEGMRRRRSL
jgi:hypothetical protein